MSHHRAALVVIAAALGLDALFGWAFATVEHLTVWRGLFCALANAVTVGGDHSPTTVGGYLVTAAECLTVVPLFAATFSLFTSGLTAVHVRTGHKATVAQVKAELGTVAGQIQGAADGHAQALHRRLDDHADLIRAAAAPSRSRKPGGGS